MGTVMAGHSHGYSYGWDIDMGTVMAGHSHGWDIAMGTVMGKAYPWGNRRSRAVPGVPLSQ